MKVGDLVMYDLGDVENEMLLRRNLGVKINQGVVSDIIEGGNIKAIIGYSIKDHTSLIDCMRSSQIFCKELSEKEIQNVGAYFLTLPSSLAMKLWVTVGDGVIENTIALHAVEVSGTFIHHRISDLLASGRVFGGMITRYNQAGIITSVAGKKAIIFWSDCEQEEVEKDLLRIINEGR